MVIESEVRTTKRKAKLPTVIGLTTKHSVDVHLSFHLLQCINQTCVMKKMEMFPMNEKDLKSDRIVYFPCQ